MPGQALGDSTFHRKYVDIGIAIILGAEGNQFAVWRESRIRFRTIMRRQAANVVAIDIGDPEITGV